MSQGMINFRIRKSSLKLLPLYILLFTSTDTILFGTNSNTIMLYVPRIVGLMSVLLLPFISKQKAWNHGRITLISLLFLMIMGASFFLNDGELNTFISRALSVMVGSVIVIYYAHDDWAKVFDNALYLISVIAIVLEVCAYVLPSVVAALPKVSNAAGLQYVSFFFGGLAQYNWKNNLIRMSGIFWEAGAFSVYLNIGLLYQLFDYVETNKKRIFVYLICLILTFSTTGYITFIVLLCSFILLSKELISTNKKILIFFFGVLAIAGIMASESIFDIVFGKIANGSDTTLSRIGSIVNGFYVSFAHPLIGVFPNNLKESMYEFSLKTSIGFGINTNTVAAHFASFGMIYGMVFLIGTLKYSLILGQRKSIGLAIFLVIILLYCGESFYSFLPYVFIFYGFAAQVVERV